MNDKKEDHVKSKCFLAAVTFVNTMLMNRKAQTLDIDRSIEEVYSLALKIYTNGKDRYWKSYEVKDDNRL